MAPPDPSTTDPDLPGPGLPGHVSFYTDAAHPTTIPADTLVMYVDLAGFPVTSDTLFALADLLGSANNRGYRLEILDDTDSPLSLAGVVITNYNVFYTNGFVGDRDILLNHATGDLDVSAVNDAGSNYQHSGLATFTNLPLDAAIIKLYSTVDNQGTEGLHFRFGGEASVIDSGQVPEPGTAMLGALGLVAGLLRRSRRRGISV